MSNLNSSVAFHPSRHTFQRQDLGSTQKRLRSTFEYASLPAHLVTLASFQPQAVCCGGVGSSELKEFVDSSSSKVLKYLHGSMPVVRGKAFSHDCSIKEWVSPASPQPKDWKRTNGQWICPSCIKFKTNYSHKMKKLHQLQNEYNQIILTTSTPQTLLPSTSGHKEFVKSYLQFKLRDTQYGDERRPDIVAEFQSNHNVKEAMSLLKLREDSSIEVNVGANERFIVDCCNGEGCQEILVWQARGQNLSCCLQCNKKNNTNERHEKLRDMNRDARVRPDSKVDFCALEEDERKKRLQIKRQQVNNQKRTIKNLKTRVVNSKQRLTDCTVCLDGTNGCIPTPTPTPSTENTTDAANEFEETTSARHEIFMQEVTGIFRGIAANKRTLNLSRKIRWSKSSRPALILKAKVVTMINGASCQYIKEVEWQREAMSLLIFVARPGLLHVGTFPCWIPRVQIN